MANKASKYCASFPCPNLAVNGAYCQEHTPARAPKTADAFYLSVAWKRFRNYYIGLHPLCEMCLAEGREVPGQIVDHVREIKSGGALTSEDNAMTLCHWHHNNKTADEARKRNNNNRLNHQSGYAENRPGRLERDFQVFER